jgi:fumarate reductase subunit D
MTYLRNRLNERSTWIMFGAGVTAASALPSPWSYISMAVAIVGALVPDGPMKDRP